MKQSLKTRGLCCMLAVLVFFAGMCAAAELADSCFWYDSASAVCDAAIKKPQYFAAVRKVCESAVIQRNQTLTYCERWRRMVSSRASHIFMTFIAAVIMLLYQLCVLKVQRDVDCKAAGSRRVVVWYIQQQDGKK